MNTIENNKTPELNPVKFVLSAIFKNLLTNNIF